MPALSIQGFVSVSKLNSLHSFRTTVCQPRQEATTEGMHGHIWPDQGNHPDLIPAEALAKKCSGYPERSLWALGQSALWQTNFTLILDLPLTKLEKFYLIKTVVLSIPTSKQHAQQLLLVFNFRRMQSMPSLLQR